MQEETNRPWRMMCPWVSLPFLGGRRHGDPEEGAEAQSTSIKS